VDLEEGVEEGVLVDEAATARATTTGQIKTLDTVDLVDMDSRVADTGSKGGMASKGVDINKEVMDNRGVMDSRELDMGSKGVIVDMGASRGVTEVMDRHKTHHLLTVSRQEHKVGRAPLQLMGLGLVITHNRPMLVAGLVINSSQFFTV